MWCGIQLQSKPAGIFSVPCVLNLKYDDVTSYSIGRIEAKNRTGLNNILSLLCSLTCKKSVLSKLGYHICSAKIDRPPCELNSSSVIEYVRPQACRGEKRCDAGHYL
ncbi:hypothetical protein AX14_011440 [Amanita brunnescens Koide BX004]|nr:hypothetical protein AX14_011440 [Amanita brunnescens Koide BX004]